MDSNNTKVNYGKNHIARKILIFIAASVVIYGLVYSVYYYYKFRNVLVSETPTINNDQELMSAAQSLDSVDLDKIDAELESNNQDASNF